MNIALCFCVRNCEKYLPSIFKNIELLRTLNFNIISIFVYDNCNDKSEELLVKYKEKYKKNVIIKNIINKSELRTVRIAKARNECLDIIYNKLKNISFHIMIDCDDVCSPKWNIDIINKYLNNFDNDDWDSISFNKKGYYDIWALLYNDFKNHCWGFGYQSNNIVKIMRNDIISILENSKTNSINVYSAFNGFAIYKTDKFKGLYYDGLYKNFKLLITDTEREKTLETIKKKFNLNVNICDICYFSKTEECCEHLFYHLSALKKGCKIKISKFIII